MSYNTRRSGGNVNYNNGMGGRGRPIQQNFVSSGQYQQGQKQGGPNVRPQQQQLRPQQQQQFQPLRQPTTPVGAPRQPSTPLGTPRQPSTPLGTPRQPSTPFSTPLSTPKPATPLDTPRQLTTPLTTPSLPTTPVTTVTQRPALEVPLKSAMKKEVKTEIISPMVQPKIQPVVKPFVPVVPPITPAVLPATPAVLPTTPAVPPTLTVEKQEAMALETENGDVKKKTLILNLKGKISKKEKRGRRNRRLKKILVPKNALMVLNELVGGHKFNFLDKDPNQANNFYTEPDTYIASVTIEGTEHVGYGKSKTAAKTAAAETALRHIILSKISSPLGPAHSTTSVNSDGDTNMEVDGEKPEEEEEDVSWLHVASFAMHKLFSNWYAEGDEKLDQAKLLARTGVADMASQLKDIKPFAGPPKTRKPAKQLPQNPQLLNPVMLLNQMRDDVTYEEFSKIGSAPNIVFVLKTSVEGQDFYGKGGNKKVARKSCAYAACSKLYGITYPAEEFDPTTSSVGVAMF